MLVLLTLRLLRVVFSNQKFLFTIPILKEKLIPWEFESIIFKVYLIDLPYCLLSPLKVAILIL